MTTPTSGESVKSNVIGGLITAAVLGLFGLVGAFVPGVWAWLTGALSSAGSHLVSTATLPTWLLYVLSLIAALWLVRTLFKVRANLTKTAAPTYLDYQQDRFFGAVWRWRYAAGRPTDTWAFCPGCDTVLVYSESYNFAQPKTVLSCETCKADVLSESGDRDYLVGKVLRQVDRKVRTGEWRSVVERKALP